jgi:perosamine synthetase
MTFSKDLVREKVLTTLSVRSAFDLFLQVRNYPKGSEIIVSAINIPDIFQIMEAHGLKYVALDIDPGTMAPSSTEALTELITDRTKCVIFAYLYGIRYDIKPYIEILRNKKIDIIEDVA